MSVSVQNRMDKLFSCLDCNYHLSDYVYPKI